MSNKLANRVKMTVSGTPGTGAITLNAALSGFQTFAQGGISNSDTVPYAIEDGASWEIGVGTYSSTGPTLTRTTITASSNSGSAISASSNSVVMLTPLAADLQSGTAAGNLVELDGSARLPAVDGSLLTSLNVNNAGSGTLAVARGGTGLTSLTAGYIPFGNGTSAFGNSANLFWDSANARLGIGNSSPSTKLTISSSGTTDTRVTVGNSTNGLQIGADGSSSFIVTNQSIPMLFYTSGQERLRIDSSGRVGIGNTTLSGFALRLGTPLTGATNAYCFHNGSQIQSDVTSNVFFMNSQPSTAAASFTLTNLFHFNVVNASLGAGSAITNQYGLAIPDLTSGTATNIGISSAVSSGTGRWNFYANGTADNYFAGNVGIGVAPSYPVDVLANSSAIGISIRGRAADGISVLRFANNSNTETARIDVRSVGILFQTGSSATERLRIDSSGNVGIGTSSPSSYGNFSVVGGAGTTVFNATFNTGTSGTGSDAAVFNVGVAGPNTGYLTSRVFGSGFAYTSSSCPGTYSIGTVVNAATAFITNDQERMRILSGGTIQIANTTAPSSNPTSSGYLYVEAGALKYRGSSGTVTTIAAA